MIENIEQWKLELLLTGRIIQDGDDSISSEEAERRFNRYIELIDAVEGDEGSEVLRVLFDSIQSEHDYGAYQSTFQAVMLFPEVHYIKALIEALPGLITRQPDWAGQFLEFIVDGPELDDTARIDDFNQKLSQCDGETRKVITNFIRAQEEEGWLEEYVHELAPNETII